MSRLCAKVDSHLRVLVMLLSTRPFRPSTLFFRIQWHSSSRYLLHLIAANEPRVCEASPASTCHLFDMASAPMACRPRPKRRRTSHTAPDPRNRNRVGEGRRAQARLEAHRPLVMITAKLVSVDGCFSRACRGGLKYVDHGFDRVKSLASAALAHSASVCMSRTRAAYRRKLPTDDSCIAWRSSTNSEDAARSVLFAVDSGLDSLPLTFVSFTHTEGEYAYGCVSTSQNTLFASSYCASAEGSDISIPPALTCSPGSILKDLIGY